ADRLDARHGLANPFGRGLLGVAVGEGYAVPLLMEPGGEMDGQGRFPHTALGIGDHYNHIIFTYCISNMISRFISCLPSWYLYGMPARKRGRKLARRKVSLPSFRQAG